MNDTPSHADLTFDNITKRYGQGPAVIEGFSHTFERGTATGLTGPNGSGKTTLLRLLSVSSFPTEGRLSYGDIDVYKHPYAYLNNVGIVHDVASLPNYMTAVELLEYILRSRKRWLAESPDTLNGLLDVLELDERRHNLIGTYSSGMLKKTQIAAALVADPDVLLLDEPFRGLDASSLQKTLQLLLDARAKGCILIVSSHRKDVLDTLCDAFIDLLTCPPTS